MKIVTTTLLTILIFGVLIFIHEFGHFISARAFGVKVNEFAIGMGPKIFAKKSKKSGTLYTLRLFPIGGYNSMEGEDEESADDGAFCSKPAWQRLIIIIAGGVMNLLLGLIVMLILVLTMKQYASTTVDCFKVGNDLVDSYSYAIEKPITASSTHTDYVELKAGDKLLSIGGKRVHTGEEISYYIFSLGAKPVDITFIRDGEKITYNNVIFDTAETSGIVYGLMNFYVEPEAKNFGNTMKQVWFGSINSIVQVFDSLKGIITGKYGMDDLSGPIGVGGAIGEAAGVGFQSVLRLVVLLAMNLGIFNLIPLPALDGGRMVFLFIEAVFKKPVPRNIEATVHGVGMILLLALAVFIAFKDVFFLFK